MATHWMLILILNNGGTEGWGQKNPGRRHTQGEILLDI